MTSERNGSSSSSLPQHPRLSQLVLDRPSTGSASPSPSPSKRRRVDSPSSSSVHTPGLDEEDLYRKRFNSTLSVLSFWNSLETKYARDLADDDIIDLYTEEIVQDKGIIRSQPLRQIGSFDGATGSHGEGSSTPASADVSDDEDEAVEEEVDDDDFEGWSNVPDNQGRMSTSFSSPKKPLFGSLQPPSSGTTEEEDMEAFMQAERERWGREGDYDAELDARLEEQRAARHRARLKARRLSSPMSDASISTLHESTYTDEDSSDELNLGYVPSPKKNRAPPSEYSIQDLDPSSDDGEQRVRLSMDHFESDGDGLSEGTSEDPLDFLGPRANYSSPLDRSEDTSSDDELLIGPPLSRPPRPASPVKSVKSEVLEDFRNQSLGDGFVIDLSSDDDPIDAFSASPSRQRLRAAQKYPTPLSPLTSQRPTYQEPSSSRHPPASPRRSQLFTPPDSSHSTNPFDYFTPLSREPLPEISRPKSPRSPAKTSTSIARDIPTITSSPSKSRPLPPTTPFSPKSPSVKGKERALDFSFDYTVPSLDTLTTADLEPREPIRPSSIRVGRASPEKRQRVLKFDPVPQYKPPSAIARSRAKSPRLRSPPPPSPPSPQTTRPSSKKSTTSRAPSLGKRKRRRSPVEAVVSESENEDGLASDASSEKRETRRPASEDEVSETESEAKPASPRGSSSKSRRPRSSSKKPASSSRSRKASEPPAPAQPAPAPPPAPPPIPQPNFFPPPAAYHQPYGYPQYAPSPDPGMLNHIIHSLNYLGFNGYNSPGPSSPHHHHPQAPPPQPQQVYAPPPMPPPQAYPPPIPMPQWGLYPQGPFGMQPYWPATPTFPGHPQQQPPPMSPQLQPQVAPPPAPAPAAETEPPQSPKRRRRRSSSGHEASSSRASPTKRGSSRQVEESSLQKNKSARAGSLSPKKASSSTSSTSRRTAIAEPEGRARSKSHSSSARSRREEHDVDEEEDDEEEEEELFRPSRQKEPAAPRRSKSDVSSPKKSSAFSRHHSAPSAADEMERTPRRPKNPSPLRRSFTASDMHHDGGESSSRRSRVEQDYEDEDEEEEFEGRIPETPSRRDGKRGRANPEVYSPKRAMRVAVELSSHRASSGSRDRWDSR